MKLIETDTLSSYIAAGGEPDSRTNQSIRDQLVRREVLLCVSGLIDNLARNPEAASALGISEEDILGVSLTYDYREAVDYWIRNDADPEGLWRADLIPKKPKATPYEKPCKRRIRTALSSLADLSESEVEELCNGLRLDPETREAYEHWIVDRHLAMNLEEHGELVSNSVIPGCNHYVWGRTCTGQSISMDHVIAEIAAGMQILDGQKYAWSE